MSISIQEFQSSLDQIDETNYYDHLTFFREGLKEMKGIHEASLKSRAGIKMLGCKNLSSERVDMICTRLLEVIPEGDEKAELSDLFLYWIDHKEEIMRLYGMTPEE